MKLFNAVAYSFKTIKLFVFLLTTVTVILAGCFWKDKSKKNKSEESTLASLQAEGKPPLHEQVLNTLKSSNDVIPDMPPVNPVHTVYNREAIIPPQCYTRTEGKYNPCYICHQDGIEGRENQMNDAELQLAYSFSDAGLKNHWHNLFENRSEQVSAISDKAILDWIAQDNYSELPERLKQAGFTGWIPDLKDLEKGADAFDEEGFAKDGSYWVAFNYKPMPSTFWPTNGSTDDVMIRLPARFRENSEGQYSRDIYKANLAIVEARLKGYSRIGSLPIDEKHVGTDLNGDGKLTKIHEVTQLKEFVGKAKGYFNDDYQYPQHTEFLHTVRYVGIDGENNISVSTRMKEVRYMKKWQQYPKLTLARYYQLEEFAKEAGHLPGYTNLGHYGLDNGMGWAIQGFIEAKNGQLRTSTHEENLFCMGCHNSIGTTIDKTFSFPRKVDGAAGWGYIDLKKMQDAPNQGETEGEYLTYLKRVGGGGEFRNNAEMYQRWFNSDGSVNESKVKQLRSIYELITPSRERALMLNKAYRVIVDDQDFIYGRDATVIPPENVYQQIDNDTSPTLPEKHFYKWDMRLDWAQKK